MVQGILSDINIRGHVNFLVAIIESGTWQSIWRELNIKHLTFADAGLAPASSDVMVWQFCQEHEYVLLTGNRNQTGADSLESTLRQRTTPRSLPVLTVSDPERFHHDRPYVDEVIESLLDILLDIDVYRGTGRLYVP